MRDRQRGRSGSGTPQGQWLAEDSGAHGEQETGTPTSGGGDSPPCAAPGKGERGGAVSVTGRRGTDRQTDDRQSPGAGLGLGAPPDRGPRAAPGETSARPAGLFPIPGERLAADTRFSDVFTGAINTHNISVLFWRFICDIKSLL